MTLSNAIEPIPGWQSKTNAELLSAVQAITVTTTDAKLYTGKHVFNILNNVEAYRLVAGTINSAAQVDPLVKDAQIWLGSEGLDFSTEHTQDMIDQLAAIGSCPDLVRDAIKAIGVQVSQPYASATLQDVANARSAILLDGTKLTLRQAAAARYNAFVDAVDAWDGSGDEPIL